MTEETKKSCPNGTEALTAELAAFWRAFPDKGVFFTLLAGWLALFHFLGNATFGYIDTSSLLKWMYVAYTTPMSEDKHGILVPLLVLGLFWWKRQELTRVPKAMWWPGLVIVAFALVLHMGGYVIQQPRICIVGFFVGIYGLMGLIWGWGWLQACFFPFILFVFCIPVGSLAESITFPLRRLASGLAAFLSNNLLGINVVHVGTQLFSVPVAHSVGTFGLGAMTPPFQYDVAPACSGLNSLISFIAFTTIYGFVTFKTASRRLLMVLSAFPLAVAANVIRLLIIIIVADAFGQEAGNSVHNSTLFSMVPYAFAFAGMLLLGNLLKEERSSAPISPKNA